jgi:hypothetical protein
MNGQSPLFKGGKAKSEAHQSAAFKSAYPYASRCLRGDNHGKRQHVPVCENPNVFLEGLDLGQLFYAPKLADYDRFRLFLRHPDGRGESDKYTSSTPGRRLPLPLNLAEAGGNRPSRKAAGARVL